MSPVLRAGPVSQARFEALKILVRVEGDRAFADIALEHALERAALEPRDAALCRDRLRDAQVAAPSRLAARRAPAAASRGWIRGCALSPRRARSLFLDRVPRQAAVDEAVSLAKLKSRVPGPAEFVNAVLRALTAPPARRPAGGSRRGDGVRWSLPTGSWPGGWRCGAGRRRRSTANGGRASRCGPTGCASTARRSLRLPRRGSRRDPSLPRSPRRGLVLEKGAAARLGPFAEGWCTVQDEAYMLIARLLDPRPGETVADVRGAGRKATHLAELMDNRGRLIAFDPRRLAWRCSIAAPRGSASASSRATWARRRRWPRAGQAAATACSWTRRAQPGRASSQPRGEVAAHGGRPPPPAAETADHPGRGGRHGEAGRAARLRHLLARARGERGRVEPFLESHGEWAVDPPTSFPVPPDARGMLRLFPHRHGTDAFTAVRLRRRGGA